MADTDSLMIMHSTYFQLKQGSSPGAAASYADACREYLSSSEGMMSFWVGERDRDKKRSVNDLVFDVAMHQVFENKKAFDQYNGHDPRHDQFVSEVNRWAPGTDRRIFDSYLNHLYIGGANTAGYQEVATDGSLPPRLMHSLYFALTDKSEALREEFTAICVKLLSGHDGECLFAIGDWANPLDRKVNDTNFDVAMDTEWISEEFLEQYSASQQHKDFFPDTKGMIKDTRVFDVHLRYENDYRVYAQS